MCIKTRTLTKKQLCDLFGLHSGSRTKRYYERLRTDFFNDETLEAIEMTLEDYKNVTGGRPFSFQQTLKIISYFQISDEELQDIAA